MKVRAAEDLSTALYCRLSVDDGEEGDSNSIVNQKKMLGDYAESHGYLNPKFYTDDGYSGTNFNRPGFQELIRDVGACRNDNRQGYVEARQRLSQSRILQRGVFR